MLEKSQLFEKPSRWQAYLPAILVALVTIAAALVLFSSDIFKDSGYVSTGPLATLTASAKIRHLIAYPIEANKTEKKDPTVAKEQIDIRLLNACVTWMQAAFLSIISAAAILFGAEYLMYRCGRRYLWKANLVCVFVCAVILLLLPRNLSPPVIDGLLVATLQNEHWLDIIATNLNRSATFAVVFVTAAACATLIEAIGKNTAEIHSLRDAMRRTLMLLYLSALFLSAGTREIASLYTWPAAWFPDLVDKDIQSLATSVSSAIGAYFSAILLAIFIPSTALLLSVARDLGRSKLTKQDTIVTEKAIDEWMLENGLGFTSSQFSITAAALAPFLVGGPFAAIGSRFFGSG